MKKVQSLAVKYRPRSLKGLVGQDHVVTQIKGMLKKGKIDSAILLAGETGCGKTTTARIISSTINCKNLDLKTLEPCGECAPCKLGEDSPDYLEINIADTRGIDDIRSLIQASRSMPTVGSYRVIVLDECHQLLSASANCLLTSLESSSPRTVWILATTNPEKLLKPIVGRCKILSLEPIDSELITKRLKLIAKKEGIDFSDLKGGNTVLKTICDLSAGRMRNAISLLDSALSILQSGEGATSDVILKTFLETGEASQEQSAAELLIALLKRDLAGLIKVSRTCGNVRALLSKTRWLIQFFLDDFAGVKAFKPYSAKIFSSLAKESKVKVSMSFLIQIQFLLAEIEYRLNNMSIEESVFFLATLGDFVTKNKE